MKHRRVSMRRAALAGGAVVAVLGAAITFQTANASQDISPVQARTLSAGAAGKLAASLDGQLGERDTAGAYYDTGSRTLVVTVVDEEAAETVRRAGGEARMVQHSMAELKGARSTLKKRATIPGTSWAVDPATNKVVVTADSTVKGEAWKKLTQVVDRLGSKAEVKRMDGEFTPYLAGGDAILTGGSRCSLGFNVVRNGQPHFLTAGHCGAPGSRWSGPQGGQPVGTMVDSRFPGDDFALVRYDRDVDRPSAVNLYNGTGRSITRAADATVGLRVIRSGSTTQVRDGVVTGLDATVNYGNGQIVEGLIQTTVCAEPGDSGGALFAGDAAVGLTSGGSGDCTRGGVTFFQPVTEALATYGARIG
ncbi:S1 family peptidase [Streptomyces sp. MUM 203J]|uniref:S1 family peptidase n=1 Tax=Streptomyces sp. MUM 203J TaxID=2791990 RepID=UPI001F046AD9|nr:S1 family peptidase [Streptomyces sp. MUM 203J]MCH0539529.1 S1 family peptidase [Streptomyces sp. MUM 203J]